MSAGQLISAVHRRVVISVFIRYEIIPGAIFFIAQAAAHDLFNPAVVNIDTWSEFHLYASPSFLKMYFSRRSHKSLRVFLICIIFYHIIIIDLNQQTDHIICCDFNKETAKCL